MADGYEKQISYVKSEFSRYWFWNAGRDQMVWENRSISDFPVEKAVENISPCRESDHVRNFQFDGLWNLTHKLSPNADKIVSPDWYICLIRIHARFPLQKLASNQDKIALYDLCWRSRVVTVPRGLKVSINLS